MTDLSALHDDEIVSEMQRRLDAGTVGFHGLISTDQANHRDNWCAILETIYNVCNAYPAKMGQRLILARVRELADQQGPQVGVYKINTTFHGKETAFQDHSPKENHDG